MLKIPRQSAKYLNCYQSLFYCFYVMKSWIMLLQSLDAQEEVDAVFINAILSAIQQRNLEVTPQDLKFFFVCFPPVQANCCFFVFDSSENMGKTSTRSCRPYYRNIQRSCAYQGSKTPGTCDNKDPSSYILG